MKYGILFAASDFHWIGVDPEALQDCWYCHQYDLEVRQLKSWMDLPSTYVWISNLAGNVISENFEFKKLLRGQGLQIRNSAWLNYSLAGMAADLGIKIPEQLPVLLDMVMRLLRFVKDTYALELALPHPVANQLSVQIQWPYKNARDHDFYQALYQAGLRPGKPTIIRIPSSGDGTVISSLMTNKVDLALYLKQLQLPSQQPWRQMEVKTIETLQGGESCFLVKVRLTAPAEGGLAQGILNFLKSKALPVSEVWWLNNVEYEFFSRILKFECLELFVNEGLSEESWQSYLPFTAMDRLSYTKCLGAGIAIDALISSAEVGNMVSPTSYWLKSGVLIYYLSLAADMGEGEFCPALIHTGTGMLQFLRRQDNLGDLVQFGLSKGLEPAAKLFQG